MVDSALINIGLPIALFIIMIGMGLTLTLRDFREVLIEPRGTLYGLVAQIVLLPALAFLLAWSIGLDGAMAVGLVVIAACPGGTTSNIFAFVGGGDVALSVILTVLASLIAIVTLPLYITLALDWFQGQERAVELPVRKTLVALLLITVLPLVIGMLVRRFLPKVAAFGERVVGVIGLLVLVAVVVVIMVNLGDQVLVLVAQGGLVAALLNIVGLALGFLGGRALRLGRAQAFTVAIELGIKNTTLGLLVTLTLLHSEEMSVPIAVYGVMMFAFGFAMLWFSRLVGLTASQKG